MTSRDRNKPHFVLDDDNEDDSEVEQSRQTPPRIVVEEPQASNRSSRRGSRDEEERHVGFAPEAVLGRDDEARRETRNIDLQQQEEDKQSKENHTYPPSSPDRPSHASDSSTAASPPPPPSTWSSKIKDRSPGIPESLAWVPSKLNWKGLRPVLRSTIASWCGFVLSESLSD